MKTFTKQADGSVIISDAVTGRLIGLPHPGEVRVTGQGNVVYLFLSNGNSLFPDLPGGLPINQVGQINGVNPPSDLLTLLGALTSFFVDAGSSAGATAEPIADSSAAAPTTDYLNQTYPSPQYKSGTTVYNAASGNYYTKLSSAGVWNVHTTLN